MDKLKGKLIECIYRSVQSAASVDPGIAVSVGGPLVINIKVKTTQGTRYFTLKLAEHV